MEGCWIWIWSKGFQVSEQPPLPRAWGLLMEGPPLSLAMCSWITLKVGKYRFVFPSVPILGGGSVDCWKEGAVLLQIGAGWRTLIMSPWLVIDFRSRSVWEGRLLEESPWILFPLRLKPSSPGWVEWILPASCEGNGSQFWRKVSALVTETGRKNAPTVFPIT